MTTRPVVTVELPQAPEAPGAFAVPTLTVTNGGQKMSAPPPRCYASDHDRR